MKTRGQDYVRRPDSEPPIFSAAVELDDIPRRRQEFFSMEWSIFYALTPTSIQLRTMKRPVDIPQPGAILIPPLQHYVVNTRQTPSLGHHIYLKVLWLERACMGLSPNPLYSLWQFADPDHHLHAFFKAAIQAVERPPNQAYWALQYAGWQLVDVLRNARSEGHGRYRIRPERTPLATHNLVARVLTYMSNHLDGTFTINDLARDARVSASTLAHTYKSATGETPMQALRRLRLDCSRQLLVSGMKLDEIAKASGFYNATHLTREFKRREGISPAAFRKHIVTDPFQRQTSHRH